MGFDSIFIHVGTQRRKAGLEGQIRLEYDNTLAIAKAVKGFGCRNCHIVTSTGANANSSIMYLKTKGRIEESLKS
ncbi:hypothetical protein GUITHDRAFT_112085 [Guillardia theta CCMP2712]|uniref:Uncharacterized protein n=2 Tax=Guillardia theta TaxID=55529 RepID=L1J0W5_GUITC|nr:hypothetical protein GUITHDRAFT_112085 [Guillardia theta CCMP2712]EKX41952.1 hypothetical protein GUITHDRAFT_112085 [Guillardia theta CCMP2712]|eukprot:XP_005828932.1 hypothetical protein GUITHDRAFT_112085 [Guillardia theta CCMP2712]